MTYPSAEQFEFLDAAERGDVATLQKRLAGGVDVNTPDDRRLPKHRTALMHAARNGHLAAIDALLAAGADVDARDRGLGSALPGGNTALLLAVKHRQLRAARRLLEAGADPRLACAGVTVLGEAAYLGDLEFLRMLLKRGLDPNGDGGRLSDAPLVSALYGGQVHAVRALLSAGADPDRAGRGGIVPLEIAIRDGLTEAVQLLVHRGVSLDRPSGKGLTFLALAIQHGRKELVRILLRRGASPNARCRNGQTPLDVAIQSASRKPPGNASPRGQSPDSSEPAESSHQQDMVDLLRAAGACTSDMLPRPGRKQAAGGGASRVGESPELDSPASRAKVGIRDFLSLVRYTEPDFCIAAVQAPIDKVSATLSNLRDVSRWVADVPRLKAPGVRRPALSLLCAVSSGPWTVIFCSLFQIGPDDARLAARDAKELSARFKSKAVAFARDTATETIGFHLFDQGRLKEHAEWMDHAGLRAFESRLRRRPAPGDSAEDYIGNVLTGLEIYVPACYPRVRGRTPVLCVEAASAAVIERADILFLPPTRREVRLKTTRKVKGS